MSIPRQSNGRPLTFYSLDLDAAVAYARKALAEGLNVEITDRDLRDTKTYRSFQRSPVLVKYWGVTVTEGTSAMGYRSASAHQIIEAVESSSPLEYGAIHADDLVEFCRDYYKSAEEVTAPK
ncbi:hypothetical protein [Streptomyces sp. 891-h]|uniref:hypothetical protein n=1 Tax=unclassified Streptomyces TaxID=2593676 RepID=UPI001FAA5CF1|nr:hypothetical protein [Streptomyces sp. 891-h]UNZ18081.1 hypothetical protein HC362_14480 [Streptomyces sp. 891-h]